MDSEMFLPEENPCGFPHGWPPWVGDSHVYMQWKASLEGWYHRQHIMGTVYRWFGRPLLRFQDSERAHHRSLKLLRMSSATSLGRMALRLLYKPRRTLPVKVFGQDYPHPFGLAAGMDKNAMALNGWTSIGLAFIEIGGVTMLGQEGNEKPRMFRADRSKALVNRMGFNNAGSEVIQQHLEHHFNRFGKPNVPLWVNLGKSKITPLEDAHTDYATSMDRLWRFTDVFVINVSSPNTPNLRELQNDEGLKRILEACHQVNKKYVSEKKDNAKPLLVKIAPDLSDEQLELVVRTAQDGGAAGIVVCNTTVERPDGSTSREERIFAETGGMSGQPLKQRSTELIRHVRRIAGPEWPIVGVGGIASSRDAWEKIRAGATLLQAYSGFVFEGPSLSKSVVQGLQKHLKKGGFNTIADAVGTSNEV